MSNIIIIGILVILIFIGLRSSIKHFKGESGCCGGGSSPAPKKKKLKNIIAKRTVLIEGMTCKHCKNRVEKCLNDIENAAATVNLKKKQAIVLLAADISNEQIRTAIEKAGYKVVDIR